MAKPVASTIGQLIPQGDLMGGFEFTELPVKIVEVADVTDGMNTTLPRTEVTPGNFLVAKNARIFRDGIGRRPGTSEYRDKPDSLPVILLVGVINESEVAKLVRITASGMHYSVDGTDWIAYSETAGASAVLNGTILRPAAVPYLDDLYVVGFEDLLRVEEATKEISVISGVGRARFVANFADRVIAANFEDEPYKIKWSDNADPTGWAGSSSGEENLVQGQEGLGDAITGLFALESSLVILRRGSIWAAERQPFEANPFRFSPVIAKLGCDLPYSAVRVPGGIMFADRATMGVYLYQQGAFPQKLDMQVDVFEDLALANWVQASFDPENMSYVLGITQTAGSTVMEKFWTYNILEKGWTYDDGPESQTLSYFAFGEGIAIDSLPGTIDSLLGSINDLTTFSVATRQYRGLATGEVIYFDAEADTDWDGTEFEFDLQSPNLGSISTRRTLTDFMAEVAVTRAGSVVLEQSKNRTAWRNTKTIAVTSAKTRLAAKKNLVTGNDIFWRLRATSSDVKVKSYWARLQEKGMQHG
jgi:hypothetical protein